LKGGIWKAGLRIILLLCRLIEGEGLESWRGARRFWILWKTRCRGFFAGSVTGRDFVFRGWGRTVDKLFDENVDGESRPFVSIFLLRTALLAATEFGERSFDQEPSE